MRRNLHKVTSMTLPHIVTFHDSFVWEVTNHCTDIISLRFEYRYFSFGYVVCSAYCIGHTTTFSHQGYYGRIVALV